MALGFTAPVDIANRALQRVGAKRITAFTDPTKNAKEISFCYDKLRRAELRRNVWRFATRRVIIRPVGTSLQSWSNTLTYASGAYVNYNGVNYVSLQGSNTNQEPDTANTYWQVFLGNTTLAISFSNWAVGTAYTQGQVVTDTIDGQLYVALNSSTGVQPSTDTTGKWTLYFGTQTAQQYDSTTSYNNGEMVFYTINNNIYSSLINGNTNDPTTSNSGWVLQACTSAPIVIPWPAGTGPAQEPLTKNIYVLPVGFMRRAPDDPSAGRTSFLGFPSNLQVDDWVLEGPYLLTICSDPIMLRFVADVSDVTAMDDLFCEGLASRIALEVAEPLTQSTSKVQQIASEYKQFMGDARNVNGIEEGPQPPPADDYIMVRF